MAYVFPELTNAALRLAVVKMVSDAEDEVSPPVGYIPILFITLSPAL